ncbi:MAG: PH domain-containing protein [Erysipelotrichaceae bacterium]
MDQFDRLPPEFDAVKDNDETIYWTGQPKFVPFLAKGIPFLIIGLLWGAFDLFFLMNMMSIGGGQPFIWIFMLLHLFPFYGSILNMFRLALVHQNTFYAITSKRLMLRTGFFGIDFKAVDYDKIQNLEVNVGPLEKLFNVGTIRAFTGEYAHTKNGTRPLFNEFIAIDEPYEVFKKIKQVSVDIKTDWNYPNKLRPEENPGYNSKYTPRE